jgi:CRISPR/Cas system-associated exonuclease Cas4 (RecB family)
LKKISDEKKNGYLPTILSVERQFKIDIGEIIPDHRLILNGAIDRIQEDPDGVIHVCDYKTTKDKKYLKNDWFQLLTYGFVICDENPKIRKVRGSYILLRHNFEYVTKEFDYDSMMRVRDEYIKYSRQIYEEKLWRPTTTPLCGYCDFIDSCKDGHRFLNGDMLSGEVAW